MDGTIPRTGLWTRIRAWFGGTAVPQASTGVRFSVPTSVVPTTYESGPQDGEGARPSPKGGAGNLITAGILDDLEHNPALKGPRWYGDLRKIGIGRKMECDSHVRQSLEVIKAPLGAAIWDFEPCSNEDLDREIADFCKWVFFEANDWQKCLRTQLHYLRDGFSMHECTDDVRPINVKRFPLHKGNGRGIIYTGFHHRPAHTVYRWHQSAINPTQLDGFEQWIVGADQEDPGLRWIPASRLVRLSQDQEGAYYPGFAQIRSAYAAWKTKITLQVIDAIRHERQGVGTPTITLPEGASDEDVEQAQLILANINAREKGYVVLPFGFVFKWESPQAINTAIGEAIERCNRDILFNCGAGFTMLGLSAGDHGSRALAQTQQGQYELQLEKDARFIAACWNIGTDGWSPVERLVRLNYGSDVQIPRMYARNMPTRDWSKLIPYLPHLINSGALTMDDPTEDQLREALYLCKRDPKTARLPPAVQSVNAPSPEVQGENLKPEKKAA